MLAPYTNSMRLGQGFNSYTQEICLDDAVIVSPLRAENILTNDGTSMRSLAAQNEMPSVWLNEPEVLIDEDRIKEAEQARESLTNIPVTMVKKGEERIISERERKEEELLERQQQIRAMERKEAVLKPNPSLSTEDLLHPPPPYSKPNLNSLEATGKSWQIDNLGGPSQTVVYTSKFVDRLSEITKDMAVSASLSIKAGTVKGGGRGSFIDVDKFLDADLNYYLSVKVSNQSINFKDPLEFNPLPPNAGINSSNFLQTYGDCFINGFLEGGEFNAIVSMKILNNAKMLDIQAAAKVAFNSGALGVEASAAFGLAKANITLNTTTTIACSWSGGGNIKPPEEPWTIDSLIRAAARFPENVSKSPQRTYATLMKYDTLRSYLALKPVELSPKSYDHVHAYTDELMENFMAYKCLAKQIQEDIRDIQTGQKRFGRKVKDVGTKEEDAGTKQEEVGTKEEDVRTKEEDAGTKEKGAGTKQGDVGTKEEDVGTIQVNDKEKFNDSIDGLQEACRSIRKQMSGIVSRIEFLTDRPDYLLIDHPDFIENKKTKIDPGENFLRYANFWSKLPRIESIKTGKANTPLTGMKMMSKPENKDEKKNSRANDSLIQFLCELEPASLGLLEAEEKKILTCLALDSTIHDKIRLSRPLGSRNDGRPFHSLDFLRLANTGKIILQSIIVGMSFSRVSSICLQYSNGLQWRRGSRESNQKLYTLDNLGKEEFIVSGKIRCGKPEQIKTIKDAVIVELCLYTNSGRSLEAKPKVEHRFGYKTKFLDDRLFSKLQEQFFHCPLDKGRLVGMSGLSREDAFLGGIYRLGFVWQNIAKERENEKKEQEAEKKEEEPILQLNKMTICEPLHAAMNPPSLIDELSNNQLSTEEQNSLNSIDSRKRYEGFLFGPILIGSKSEGSGETFNDLDYLQTMTSQNDWPSRLEFGFQKNDQQILNLTSVRINYGRHSILHGCQERIPDQTLLVPILNDEYITMVEAQEQPSGGMPSNLRITVDKRKIGFHGKRKEKEGDNKKEDDKETTIVEAETIKTFTLYSNTTSPFKSSQTLKGSERLPGFKGFFGRDRDSDIVRLLPIWSSD